MENKFKINFRQQKYMLPLITYPFVIGTLYLFCDMFNTELAENYTGSIKPYDKQQEHPAI